MLAHQTRDAVHADPPALSTQSCMHARTAVDGAILGMNAADIDGKGTIGE
jgi:hypothetical protein